MKDYINQQKKGYLNRLKHIQEKLFDYQMQLEELEDDLDNEGRDAKDDDYDDWCAEHIFDLMTMDYEERCFTEYLGEILERMHGLKKERRMDFMIIPRWLLDDSLHVDYDRMLDDVKKELKENRKALRLPCQRD